MTQKICFVFGSNEGGLHGAGAARTAREKYGAVMGVGVGPQGQSYALPTVGWRIGDRLPFETVKHYVERFIIFARLKENADVAFQVTRIGCGLAGFYDKDIAPLFKYAPDNCWFDEAWRPFLGDKKKYWGTF